MSIVFGTSKMAEGVPGMEQPGVLLVVSDVAVGQRLEAVLTSGGMSTRWVTNPLLVLDEEVERIIYDLVLLDMFIPQMGGLNVLARLRDVYPQTKVIVITNDTDKDTAIAAFRLGAFDCFEKSAPMDFVLYTVHQALQAQKRGQEHRQAHLALQHGAEGPQARAARVEALPEELREAAIVALARNIEQARRDAEIRVVMRLRSLLQPLLSRLRQRREMMRYVAQLDAIVELLEESNGESLTATESLAMKLSASELRIALMVKDGLTSDEIATHLHVSSETVKSHRKNIRTKLGLRGSRETLRAYLESFQGQATDRAQC